MKTAMLIAFMMAWAAMVLGESRFALLAYNLTDSSTPPALVSPRFTASVSLDQEGITGQSASERFSLAAGFQAATEGFTPGYDGSVDSSGNGVPDIWETRYFGGVGMAPDLISKRGQDVPTHTVYVWGVDPHDEGSVLELDWEDTGVSHAIAFQPVQGRLYDIWSATDLLDESSWQPMPELQGISGQGQWVILEVETGDAPLSFYRIHVRLASP